MNSCEPWFTLTYDVAVWLLQAISQWWILGWVSLLFLHWIFGFGNSSLELQLIGFPKLHQTFLNMFICRINVIKFIGYNLHIIKFALLNIEFLNFVTLEEGATFS